MSLFTNFKHFIVAWWGTKLGNYETTKPSENFPQTTYYLGTLIQFSNKITYLQVLSNLPQGANYSGQTIVVFDNPITDNRSLHGYGGQFGIQTGVPAPLSR